MVEHMILDAEHNLVPADSMTWALFFEDIEARIVAKENVGEARVSTVFLGIDHGFDGAPLWFETVIFDGPYSDSEWRYTTWDEAVAGHERVVAALTEGREP